MSQTAALVQGPVASARIAGALERVRAALPYLRASCGAPPGGAVPPGTSVRDGDWMRCDQLLGDAAWLEATVRNSGRRLGTGAGAVATSLFVQGYTYRVLTLAVSCWLMDGVVPSSGAADLAMALSSARPALVAYLEPVAFEPGDDPDAALGYIIESAIDAHLRLLVDAICCRVRVGRRLLWGNAAASAATAFRTMEGLLGPWVKPLGERFFELAPPEMLGQGNFLSLEYSGRCGWYWERRNCCLNDRLPRRIRCADCSLTPPEERRAAYLAGLARVGTG
jgi:ferric iron reductase protein FhuF